MGRDADHRIQTRYKHKVFFVGSDVREAVRERIAEYIPISLAQVPKLIAIGRIPVDVAFIQVTPPDEFGYVSLGVSVDIVSAAVQHAGLVIAEVNPAMPRTMGDSTLHISRIHKMIALARNCSDNVEVERDEDTVLVTTLFQRRRPLPRLRR